MLRRAEQMDETRQRIVEAAVTLHGTVGPAATTISAIADLAGVTRVTVYRHFPDEDALFGACSAHWLSEQRLPDPAAWAQIGDPEGRLAAGLADLYRFYAAGEAMLTNIYRDVGAMPGAQQRGLQDRQEQSSELLAAAFDGTPAKRRLIRAVVGHAVSFWTWRSLCVTHGLSQPEAVDLMTRAVMSVALDT
jgi:AcrR family transcriptional regulator